MRNFLNNVKQRRCPRDCGRGNCKKVKRKAKSRSTRANNYAVSGRSHPSHAAQRQLHLASCYRTAAVYTVWYGHSDEVSGHRIMLLIQQKQHQFTFPDSVSATASLRFFSDSANKLHYVVRKKSGRLATLKARTKKGQLFVEKSAPPEKILATPMSVENYTRFRHLMKAHWFERMNEWTNERTNEWMCEL